MPTLKVRFDGRTSPELKALNTQVRELTTTVRKRRTQARRILAERLRRMGKQAKRGADACAMRAAIEALDGMFGAPPKAARKR